MQKLEKALWIKDSKMSREVTKMFCYSYALWDKCFYPNFIRTFTSPLFLSPIHFALHKIWEKGQRFQIKSMRAEENVIWRFSSLTRYGQRWSDARLNIANIGGGHLVRVTHHIGTCQERWVRSSLPCLPIPNLRSRERESKDTVNSYYSLKPSRPPDYILKFKLLQQE